MDRTSVNPTPFSLPLGFDQAVLVEGHRRQLVCSAQDSVGADGVTLHVGDLRAQLVQTLDNLEAVLAGAGMTLADVVRLNFYATDLGALFADFGVVTERFAGHRFATTVLGVSKLAGPDLLVALEATAMD